MSRIRERHALQPERTALAWQRIALTAMVLFLPLVVVAVRLRSWWLVTAVSAGAMAGALLALGVHGRFAELRDDTRGYSPFPLMVRVVVVSLMGAAGGVASALVVVGHRR